MTLIALHTAVLAAIVTIGVTAGAAAQTTAADPHHPNEMLAQAAPPQPGTTPPGMMGQGMMGGMPMTGMRGHMMKIMFAIADVEARGH